ncbi:MAG: bifunctional oligoribonuclease and phosphatase NrnA, partial [Candidatus Hydrogenedentes bacterium]|nr:bifunctional oligoribonuclease and phosphatase NrnA [Candidatus Hydrogenedentota bacterium]
MTTTSDLADIVAELRAADRFLVTSHLNPDGDAIGSTLALGYLLEALGKTGVTCMNQDPVPRILQWIAGADRLASAESDTNTFDTVIVVDVAQRDRLGSVDKRIAPGARIVVIDHHQEQNPCGDVNFVDPSYAAAGEIVADLFDAAGVPMTREAAECI